MKFILLFLAPITLLHAQNKFTGFQFHTGLSFQSAPTKSMNYPNFSYKNKANMQGLGLDLGLNYQFEKLPLSVTYFTRLRYDYQYSERTDVWNGTSYSYKDVKGFIADQNFQIKYHYNKRKNDYIGLGITFHNIRGNYFVLPYTTSDFMNFKTNFTSFNLVFGQNIYKNLFLEEKIGFIPSYQSTNLNAFYFSLSLKYNFPVKISLAPKIN